jgi:hypothetical protein
MDEKVPWKEWEAELGLSEVSDCVKDAIRRTTYYLGPSIADYIPAVVSDDDEFMGALKEQCDEEDLLL